MKKFNANRLWFSLLFTVIFSCIGISTAAAKDYSFSWSPNAEPVEGYKLYYKNGGEAGPPFNGTSATEGSSPVDLGKVTTTTITGLEDNTTYHFALTAYNGNEESDFTDVITVFPSGDTSDPLSATINVNSLTGEAPLAVTFNGSTSTGSITEYSWDFGDGGTATGSSTSHTYQNSGTYTAVLTIRDSAGQTEEADVVLTVSEPTAIVLPVAAISASVRAGEAPLSVHFDGGGSTSVAPPVSSYNWSFGDNSTGSGGSVDHVYNEPGVYSAVLTVEDNNGVSEAVSTTITVTEASLPDPPVAVISPSATAGTTPFNVILNASASTGSISSYSWDFGDNSTDDSGPSVTHVYNEPGNYTVTLTVNDSFGQTSQQHVEMVVSNAITAGVSYQFSWSANADPVDGYKFYYKKGGEAGPPFDGTDAAEGSSAIDLGMATSFTISGLEDNTTYHFALTAYNGDVESDFTDVITVFPVGDSTDPLSADITVFNQSGEAPLTVDFDGSGSTGTTNQFLWNFGDGDVAEGVRVSHNYDSVGVYTTTLVVRDASGNSSQETIDINVTEATSTELTPPTAAINIVGDEQVAPFTASFSGAESSSAPGTSIILYEWDFGDGSETQYGISVEHYYSQPATYTASLTVTDSAGQTSETFALINANAASGGSNTAPTAQFSISSVSGVMPLYVSFDAFESSDPEGDQLEYVWSFGDGGTAAGEVTEHVYSNAGIYTVELFVEDTLGATSIASQTITVMTEEEYKQQKAKGVRAINTIINLLLLNDNKPAEE